MDKLNVTFEPNKYRVKVWPLKMDGSIDIPTVLRNIKFRLRWNWQRISAFAGLRNSNAAFRVAYLAKNKNQLVGLNALLTLDNQANCAYFYHHAHAPETTNPIPPHVAPTIINKEPTDLHIVAGESVYIGTRVAVNDIIRRKLTLTLTPTNGTLYVGQYTALPTENAAVVLDANVGEINNIIKSTKFKATEEGTATIEFKIDDGAGEANSVVTTTVSYTVDKGVDVSIPTLNVPSSPEVVLNTISTFDSITVSDRDNKILNLKVLPIGADLIGFKDRPLPLLSGNNKIYKGTPDEINAILANVKVTPLRTDASIHLELTCGTDIKIEDGIRFVVKTNEEVTEAQIVQSKAKVATQPMTVSLNNDTEHKPTQNQTKTVTEVEKTSTTDTEQGNTSETVTETKPKTIKTTVSKKVTTTKTKTE